MARLTRGLMTGERFLTNFQPISDLILTFFPYNQDVSVELRISPGLFEILTTGAAVHEVGSVPLVSLNRLRITGVDAFLKSALDYVGAAVGLILLLPF